MNMWLRRAPWRDARLSSRRVTLASALEELGRVHILEQARLLREACHLRCSGRGTGSAWRMPAGRRPRDLPRRSWREACLEEIATATADGIPVPSLLRVLARGDPAEWPPASTIAIAALEIDRSHDGLVVLGCAWECEGRLDQAIVLLREVLGERPGPEPRGRALEVLALALESRGDARNSLDCYEAALEAGRSGIHTAVSLLSLALRIGDDARAGIAARRLHGIDLAVPGIRTRFESALAGARARSTQTPGMRASAIRRFARERGGPEALVAQASLGA